MPTLHTKVTLFNLALDAIGEFPISNVTDDNAYARWLNRNFPHYVTSALRQEPWNFAVEMHSLSAEPVAPAYRWRYQYGLPPGWVRVLPVTVDGRRDSQLIPYEVKRNKLLCSAGAPRPVEIVMNVQEPGEWDALFANMIALRLANGMAHRFTAKASYVAMTKEAAEEAYAAAAEINAFEGTPAQVEEYDIIRARGDFGSFGRGYA